MKEIEKLIVKAFSKLNFPVIINSYGRSGSTVLTNSIVKSAIRSYIKALNRKKYKSISQEAWDLDNTALKDGFVYKTHDYPPQIGSFKKIRMIYTYADPVNVVLSLQRLRKEKSEDWMKLHYLHLKTTYGNFQNMIKEDQLQLHRHFKTWMAEDRFPILFVKYESMWDYQDEISRYLELPITLPVRKARKSKIETSDLTANQLKTLNETYQELRDQISLLDDFFITNKHFLKNK